MTPAIDALQELSEDELKGRLVSQLYEVRHGGFLAQVWATICAGRTLLALKGRCQYGDFDAAKAAKGLSLSAAHRFMTLAKSEEFSQCGTCPDVAAVIDRNEWRSMRNILDHYGLAASKRKPERINAEIEDVAMCRHSGGYLFRCSVTGDPRYVGERIEVSMETKDPTIARSLRDFGVRLLDAVGILPDRTRKKWEAHKAGEPAIEEALVSEKSIATGHRVDPLARQLITQVVAQVEAINMREEFAPILPALQDYLRNEN